MMFEFESCRLADVRGSVANENKRNPLLCDVSHSGKRTGERVRWLISSVTYEAEIDTSTDSIVIISNEHNDVRA